MKEDGSNDRILVFFDRDSKCSASQLIEYVSEATNQWFTSCMIIIAGKITPSAEKTLKSLSAFMHIEVFNQQSLWFKVIDHQDVPHHEVISPQEVKELCKTYNIKPCHFPKIPACDPVAK